MSATGKIRIVQIPVGEAPESIRSAWLGLILPCEPIAGYGIDVELGAITNKKLQKRFAFHVPQAEAIDVLGQSAPLAKEWWNSKGFPKQDQFFVFGELEAEIISGVSFQRVIEISDLDPGVNDRFLP